MLNNYRTLREKYEVNFRRENKSRLKITSVSLQFTSILANPQPNTLIFTLRALAI